MSKNLLILTRKRFLYFLKSILYWSRSRYLLFFFVFFNVSVKRALVLNQFWVLEYTELWQLGDFEEVWRIWSPLSWFKLIEILNSQVHPLYSASHTCKKNVYLHIHQLIMLGYSLSAFFCLPATWKKTYVWNPQNENTEHNFSFQLKNVSAKIVTYPAYPTSALVQ